MLQIRKEQIQSLRQNINLTFRQEVLDILKENDYETIEDPNTNDIGIKDKRGNISWLRYNQDAQPNIFELPSGTSYNLNYYEDGALQSIQMPNGNAIELFTQDGKLLNLKHKGGSSLSLKYNKENKISDVVISNKKKFQFKYDDQYGYFNALVDGNKETKHFNHDNSGNLRQKIDAENRTTYFHYEVGEDDLKEIHYPDGSRETYRYDEEENYLEITQRNNSVVKNFYDDDDNLRQVEWQDGSYILIEKDDKDDIASIQNENVLINLKKDDKNRIIEEESDFASIKYEYDVEQQLSKLTYSDNYELTYEYDVDGELSVIKDSEGNQHLFSHDAKASTDQIIFQGGNAVYTIREHFNGQIAETNINTNSGHSFGQIYEYDDQERLSKINDSRCKFPTRYISYDDADHLLAVKDDKEKIIEKFEYDKSGQMTFANNNTVVIGPMEEVKFYGEKQLTYDANGNLANFNGIKALYKNNGVLAEIEANGQKWNYEYDPFGRRIKKTNGRETVTYIWAGVQLLEEINTSAEGNQTKQKYLYRPFEQIPFAIKDEKGLYLLQQDHRGAIIRAVDTFGELVWEAEYDAFGKAYPRTEKINQPWRLQGQYFDKESELHYNVGRYYCPKLKTYLSRDPQWHEVQASNYNYANNDPYNKADSLGCFWEEVGSSLAKVKNAVADTATKVKDYTVATAKKVGNAVKRAWEYTKSVVVNAVTSGINWLKKTYTKVKNKVKQIINIVGSFVDKITTAVVDSVKCVYNQAKNAISDFFKITSQAELDKLKATRISKSESKLSKKERFDNRLKLIEKAKKNLNSLSGEDKDKALKAIERLERNNKAVERARLSDHIYSVKMLDDNGNPLGKKYQLTEPLPEGWEIAKIDGFENPYENKDSGYAHVVYRNTYETPPKTVLVLRGSGSITDEVAFEKDWKKTNFKQGLGQETKQYLETRRQANRLAQLYPDFEVAGHSKAGGQASLVAIALNKKGYTFNPAGLHKNTLENTIENSNSENNVPKGLKDAMGVNKNGENKIDAYNFEHDGLNNSQDTIVPKVQAVSILPALASDLVSGTVSSVVNIENNFDFNNTKGVLNMGPQAAGTRHTLKAVDEDGNEIPYSVFDHLTFNYHSMPFVINSIEVEKQSDTEQLNKLFP